MSAAGGWAWLFVGSALAGPAGETESAAASAGGGSGLSAWAHNAGPLLLVAGLIIILVTLLRLRRRPPQERAARPSSSADFGESRRGREGLDRLAVDLEETARAVSALLDTKIRTLDRLIADADGRIARLEGLSGPAARGEPGVAAAEQPAAPPPEELLAHHAHIFGLADQGLSVQEIAEKTGHPRGEVELVLSLRRIRRPDQ